MTTTGQPWGVRGHPGDNPVPAAPLPVDSGVAEGAGVLRGQVGTGGQAPCQADAEEGPCTLQGEKGLWGAWGTATPPSGVTRGEPCLVTQDKKSPKNQIPLVPVTGLAGDIHGVGDAGLRDGLSHRCSAAGDKGAARGHQHLWDGGTWALERAAGLGWLCRGSRLALRAAMAMPCPPTVTPLAACSNNTTTCRNTRATHRDNVATHGNTTGQLW